MIPAVAAVLYFIIVFAVMPKTLSSILWEAVLVLFCEWFLTFRLMTLFYKYNRLKQLVVLLLLCMSVCFSVLLIKNVNTPAVNALAVGGLFITTVYWLNIMDFFMIRKDEAISPLGVMFLIIGSKAFLIITGLAVGCILFNNLSQNIAVMIMGGFLMGYLFIDYFLKNHISMERKGDKDAGDSRMK